MSVTLRPTSDGLGVEITNRQAGESDVVTQIFEASDGFPGERAPTSVTNATATMANITALSMNVVSGRKYNFRCVLFMSQTAAAEGLQWDFNGGSAAATSFIASAILYGAAAVVGFDPVTALSTAFVLSSVSTATIIFEGSIVPSSTGTFIPRFAEVSHIIGTASVLLGSYVTMKDTT